MSTEALEVSAECRRWNERYGAERSFFGDAPSPLLLEALSALSGQGQRALCLGEGEGRDALYLARRGLLVTAVDGAHVGLEKLRSRALEERLPVSTVCADLASYRPAARTFSLVSSFYCHLEPELRRSVLGRAQEALTPDGLLVMEGFDRAQRLNGRASGGPRDLAVLYDADELRAELDACFAEVVVEARTMVIHYGRHQGEAEVVRAVARAPRSTACADDSR